MNEFDPNRRQDAPLSIPYAGLRPYGSDARMPQPEEIFLGDVVAGLGIEPGGRGGTPRLAGLHGSALRTPPGQQHNTPDGYSLITPYGGANSGGSGHWDAASHDAPRHLTSGRTATLTPTYLPPLNVIDGFGLRPTTAALTATIPFAIGRTDAGHETTQGAGRTPGLMRILAMTPEQVHLIRESGTSIPGLRRAQTDYIQQVVGFSPTQMGKLPPIGVASNLDLVQHYVQAASHKYGVPPDLLNAMITLESRGVQNAVSATGALGISQLTYGIYGSKDAVRQFGSAINPFDPAQAIDRHAAFLSDLLSHYDGDIDQTMAAYNQGQPPVDRAIKLYGKSWRQDIDHEGQHYISSIRQVLSGSGNIPGYFGTPH